MEPSYTDVARQAGISVSYAHEIVNGRRDPSRSLAVHIYRSTGWRHETIASLSDDEIALLEKIEPWEKRNVA